MPPAPTLVDLSDATHAACWACSGFVPHLSVRGGHWVPVPHEAPCGRPCVAGGVSRAAYLLGELHRGDQCPCMSDEDA
jgi:hypothetical protein